MLPDTTARWQGQGPAPLQIEAERQGDLLRLTLSDPAADTQAPALDGLALTALETELTDLRQIAESLPILAWREDETGQITWANHAYLRQAIAPGLPPRNQPPRSQPIGAQAGAPPEGHSPPDTPADYQPDAPPQAYPWPLPRLFDLAPGLDLPRRVKLTPADSDRIFWFDLAAQASGQGGRLIFAQPVDEAVRAETALRGFVQTLTKTFAHLPIGLAIFDRQRQLALFNPALVDLTTLPADFLSQRPTLFSLLDRLREARMIPEPRDYRGWRRQMVEIERGAASDQYEELWSLPSGLTYRVTGRPHPDGAVALLIEDITAEISLTRRFRAEIDLGQAVLDALPEALAIFHESGSLRLANAAYARIWQDDPGQSLGDLSLARALAQWQSRCLPDAALADLDRRLLATGQPQPGQVTLVQRAGDCLEMSWRTIAGGALMIRFAPQAQAPHLQRRRLRMTETGAPGQGPVGTHGDDADDLAAIAAPDIAPQAQPAVNQTSA